MLTPRLEARVRNIDGLGASLPDFKLYFLVYNLSVCASYDGNIYAYLEIFLFLSLLLHTGAHDVKPSRGATASFDAGTDIVSLSAWRYCLYNRCTPTLS